VSAAMRGCLKKLVESGSLNSAESVDALRANCVKEINDSNCIPVDKRKMIRNLEMLQTVESIQQFIFNAYLKFNGMGIINKNKNY
jgi:hypothetical protein